jgi:hypothetical protein
MGMKFGLCISLRDNLGMRMFESKVQMTIYVPKSQDAMGG